MCVGGGGGGGGGVLMSLSDVCACGGWGAYVIE